MPQRRQQAEILRKEGSGGGRERREKIEKKEHKDSELQNRKQVGRLRKHLGQRKIQVMLNII